MYPFIQNYIFESKIEHQSHTEFMRHSDNVRTILDFFERCKMFQHANEKDKDSSKSYHKIILPQTLEVMRYNPLKVPFITKPTTIKKEHIDNKIKPILFGSSNVTKSSNLVASLNISQHKKFIISENFLALVCLFTGTVKYKEFFDIEAYTRLVDKIEDLNIYLKKYSLDLGI